MVLRALFGIMSILTITEARIIALTLLMHGVGHDIPDLSGGLLNILLPIWLVFHLSLLPAMSLLHWLPILLWLKLMLVVVVNRPIVCYKLLLPFSNESLVHQSLEIWEIKHTESTPELRI